MADLNTIVDQLSTLTVMEAAELVKKLEEKWGVSAAAAPVMMAGGGGAAAAAPVEEKTEFTVVLADAGPNKINVIKEVRAITGLRAQEEARGRGRQGRDQVSVSRECGRAGEGLPRRTPILESLTGHRVTVTTRHPIKYVAGQPPVRAGARRLAGRTAGSSHFWRAE